MYWSLAQRRSSIAFFVAFLLQAHFGPLFSPLIRAGLLPRAAVSPLWTALTGLMLLTGIVHACASLYIALTDYRPFIPRRRELAFAVIGLGVASSAVSVYLLLAR